MDGISRKSRAFQLAYEQEQLRCQNWGVKLTPQLNQFLGILAGLRVYLGPNDRSSDADLSESATWPNARQANARSKAARKDH